MSRDHNPVKANERHGHLLTVSDAGIARDGHRLWLCLCDCGNRCTRQSNALRLTKNPSCGCMRATYSRQAATKHGARNTPEYSSWRAMKERCLNPTSKDFYRYGGAGINVQPEWVDSFEVFLAHVGPRPKGTTLDRIDTRRGYVTGNVKWSTDSEQTRNQLKSVIWMIQGERFETLADAAQRFGVKVQTIHKWVHGYTDKRRDTTKPPKEGCYAIGKY